MTQKHEITLQYPVEWNGETLTKMSFRRPKGRELRKLENGKGTPMDRSFEMMADLAEVDVSVIDDMDPVDIAKIDEWLEPILDPKGRARR